jgi:4-oxalocrotonate tautomerase
MYRDGPDTRPITDDSTEDYFSNAYTRSSQMPYVNIKVTDEGVTIEQKKQLISGTSQLLQKVLNKDPSTTYVVIDEVDADNWGVGDESVTQLRARQQDESGGSQKRRLQR